jgi:protein phosphatase
MLPILTGAATSAGRTRAVNEDAYLVGRSIFAIADGMGGHAAGDRASALVIEHLADIDSGEPPRREQIVDAIIRANAAIVEEAEHAEHERGMGTTLVGLSLLEIAGSPHGVVFNVGDSRLYLFEGGRLEQLTVDHSEVQELVDAGEITRGEVANHPHRNVITRAVGSRPVPAVDTWTLSHQPGCVYLLCSDGLTTELDDDRIATILRSAASPQDAADQLVAAAEAAGGRDNVTVVVVGTPDPHTGDPADDSIDDTLPRRRELFG